jgi:hypothetical protein
MLHLKDYIAPKLCRMVGAGGTFRMRSAKAGGLATLPNASRPANTARRSDAEP